jgi:hypothetical protein
MSRGLAAPGIVLWRVALPFLLAATPIIDSEVQRRR